MPPGLLNCVLINSVTRVGYLINISTYITPTLDSELTRGVLSG